MPTQLDRAMTSRNLLLAFAGLVTAVAAYSIYTGNLFPQAKEEIKAQAPKLTTKDAGAKSALKDPKGDPQRWSEAEMRGWLESRDFMVGHADHEELLAMVMSKMHEPSKDGSAKSAYQQPTHKDPKGDPQRWSEGELRGWLESRDLMVGHADHEELLAMVMSKMHEPKV